MAVSSQSKEVDIFGNADAFDHAQRVCKVLTASNIVPKQYQGNMPNALVAYEIAVRTGKSVFMVMQNLDIIQGSPSWSSKYVISAINSCGRFTPLKFEYENRGEKIVNYTISVGTYPNKTKQDKQIKVHDIACYAYAYDGDGKLIKGPIVSIEMAVKEGWYTKSDSKWQTMPEMMLSYRAAKFFGNLHIPDVLMGMMTSDELEDISQSGTAQSRSTHAENSSSAIDNLNAKVIKVEGTTVAPDSPAVGNSDEEELM